MLCLGSVLSCLLCFALDTPLSSLHPASAAALRLAPALGRAAARAQLYALSALLLFWSLSNLTVPNPNLQPQPEPQPPTPNPVPNPTPTPTPTPIPNPPKP